MWEPCNAVSSQAKNRPMSSYPPESKSKKSDQLDRINVKAMYNVMQSGPKKPHSTMKVKENHALSRTSYNTSQKGSRNDATRRTITQLQTRQECQVEPSRNDTTTTSWMILCRRHASSTFWLLRRQADQRSTKTMASLCPTWLRCASDKCFPRC